MNDHVDTCECPQCVVTRIIERVYSDLPPVDMDGEEFILPAKPKCDCDICRE